MSADSKAKRSVALGVIEAKRTRQDRAKAFKASLLR